MHAELMSPMASPARHPLMIMRARVSYTPNHAAQLSLSTIKVCETSDDATPSLQHQVLHLHPWTRNMDKHLGCGMSGKEVQYSTR